jgi:hypothetical protein
VSTTRTYWSVQLAGCRLVDARLPGSDYAGAVFVSGDAAWTRWHVDLDDATRYVVDVSSTCLVMNVADCPKSRAIYTPTTGLLFCDGSYEMRTDYEHTVAVYRWLTSVAIGSDFIEIPPRWKNS